MSALDLDDDVKPYLNITDATKDTELQAVMDAAEAALAQRVGPLESTTVTEHLFCVGYDLIVRTVPLISVTSITPYGGTALPLSNLDTPSSGVIRYLDGTGFRPALSYTVVYQAGRSTLPNDLKLAALELVRHMWSSQRGSGNARPRPAADLSNTLPGSAYTFPIRVEQLIAPHELRLV